MRWLSHQEKKDMFGKIKVTETTISELATMRIGTFRGGDGCEFPDNGRSIKGGRVLGDFVEVANKYPDRGMYFWYCKEEYNQIIGPIFIQCNKTEVKEIVKCVESAGGFLRINDNWNGCEFVKFIAGPLREKL